MSKLGFEDCTEEQREAALRLLEHVGIRRKSVEAAFNSGTHFGRSSQEAIETLNANDVMVVALEAVALGARVPSDTQTACDQHRADKLIGDDVLAVVRGAWASLSVDEQKLLMNAGSHFNSGGYYRPWIGEELLTARELASKGLLRVYASDDYDQLLQPTVAGRTVLLGHPDRK